MSNFQRPILCIIYIFFTCISICYSQSPIASKANTPINKAEKSFSTLINEKSRLYNGPAFLEYENSIIGSANFQELNTFSNGSVVYDEYKFDDVPLIYDLFHDKLISFLPGPFKYSLISTKVSEFRLNDHHFIYINVIDTAKSVIKSGFFDLIYDGQSKILVKRTKSMQTTIEDKMLRNYFTPKTYYYIERNQKYTLITGQKAFFNYFKDKKSEMRKKLKESKIKYRKQPEAAMILLASYYESSAN